MSVFSSQGVTGNRIFFGAGILITAILLTYVATGIYFLRVPSPHTDFWQHLSAVRSLARAPWSPTSLFYPIAYDTHLYTPYHLFWSLFVHFGIIPFDGIRVAMGVSNIILFSLACYLLATKLLKSQRMFPVILFTLLFLWGDPIEYSGFYNFSTLPKSSIYPYWFSLSVSLILISVLSPAWTDSLWRLCLLCGTTAIVFLIHPITSSFFLVSVFAKVISWENLSATKRMLPLLAAGGGLALTLAWPYFSVSSLVMGAQRGWDYLGSWSSFYENIPLQLGPALLGVIALVFLAYKRQHRFVLVGFGLFFLIFLANGFLEISGILSRHLIYVTFFLQLAVLAVLRDLQATRTGVLVLGVFALVGAVSMPFQIRTSLWRDYAPFWDISIGASIGTHSFVSEYADLRKFGDTLPDDSVVMIEPDLAFVLTTFSNAKIVGEMVGHPQVKDSGRRKEDASAFFDSKTTNKRRKELIDHYNVDYVVLRNTIIDGENNFLLKDKFTANWVQVFRGNRFSLYRTGRGSQAGPALTERGNEVVPGNRTGCYTRGTWMISA